VAPGRMRLRAPFAPPGPISHRSKLEA
jgi:hypothetical protein